MIFLFKGHRGRQECRDMRWGDIRPNSDSTGQFLEFRERATKMGTGENSDTRERPSRAYENKKKPDRCPVKLFYIYESHRPVSTLNEHSPFYLSVNNRSKDLSNPRSWNKISAIGVNTIGAFLRKMSKGAGVVEDTQTILLEKH